MDVLSSSRLRLRPVTVSDNAILYKWRNDHDYLQMVSPRRTVINFDKFLDEQKRAFEGDRHMQFIIERRNVTCEPVGTIYTFSFNLTDGFVFMNMFIDSPFRRRGYGPEASTILTCYLFDFFPLYKVCYEAFGYNKPSLSVMKTACLNMEGVFKGHRFFGGERHDVVRFATYRDSLEKIRDLNKKFGSRRGGR